MKSPLTLFSILPWLMLPMAHAASDVTISTAVTSGGSFSGSNPNVFSPSAAAAFIQASAIQTLLNAGTSVTINTASAFSGNGDVILSTGFSKTTGAASGLVINAARDITISGALSASGSGMPVTLNAVRNITNSQGITTGGGAVVLAPSGEFTLGGAINAGVGAISLQGGVMKSSNSYTITTSDFTVASGASLNLIGTITGNLSVSGRISAAAPGTTGTLQVSGNLNLQSGSETVVEISGSSGSNIDRINATGAVTVGGTLKVDLIGSYPDAIASTSSHTIIQGGSVTGTFNGLPNGARYMLSNDRGSMRVNYTATTVTLDDWQPVVTTLTWDPGTAEGGTQIFTNTNTRAGRHYFRLVTQSTDIGAWRSRLTVHGGEASLYLAKDGLATTASYAHRSIQAGSDGLIVRDDQYVVGDQWSLMVFAEEGASWSLVSGRAYVHDLGALPFTDANNNGQYDIGETVAAQNAPITAMPPEGIRFYKSVIPAGTPAWSLWLNGSTREIAVRSTKLPFPDNSNRYTRKQAGQMLMVPSLLGAETNTWFSSISAPMGEMIGVDSRIQTVSDLAFNGSVNNVSVSGAPYRVFRTQVPVDQIAWDISAVPVAGDPNICVRKGNVPAEFDNEAFSQAPGAATEGITLVPDYLTDGTWYITVWGTGNYSFNLKNGDPVVTPLSFTDLKMNDQTTRSGWRFYALTDIPAQVGALGWELELSNHVPGTQIAVRRNKVPSRWQKREDGATTVTDTNAKYMDDSSTTGFLQRVNHQADVWYVGVFTAQQPLGAFSLNVHPVAPQSVSAESGTTLAAIPAFKWKYVRLDVPAGIDGLDLGLKNITGGNPAMVIRRDLLPSATATTSSWSPSTEVTWPSGHQWAGGTDWTGREYDKVGNPRRKVNHRIVMAMGHPLQPGTYYVGIYNDGADPITGLSGQAVSLTLQSRIIGASGSIPINVLPLAAGSNVTLTDLVPREAAYFKVTVPENVPSWQFTLVPSAGEMMIAARRGWIPDFAADTSGDIQASEAAKARQFKVQKAGAERYVLLPPNNQSSIVAGDYYLAAISEGLNPSGTTVAGTEPSSGKLTNHGPLPVKNLGSATTAPITEAVSLVGAEVKAYQFTVPAGTASLELRLDNRVGNPAMTLISGERLPQPDSFGYDVGVGGGQTTAPTGGVARVIEDDLLTIANPPAGIYSLMVRADELGGYPDASASLVIVANAPVPLEFNNGVATVTGQAATSWRYFQVTVPAGVMGWDMRLKTIGSGLPAMVIRRDQLPSTTGTTSSWTPSSSGTWPSGNQWAGGLDWTGRTFDTAATPRRGIGDRVFAAMGRPLEQGTYIVGIYNSTGKDPISGTYDVPASYTVESRGVGTGQAIGIREMPFTAGGTVDTLDVTPREAAFFKVTVPANVPRWEFTLAPSAGEMLMAVRRGSLPDFSADAYGNIEETAANKSYQTKVQKTGAERYLMLPPNNQDALVAGDYYVAAVSEGVNPSSGVVGSVPSSGTLISLGAPPVQDLGAIPAGETTQAVALSGTQVKFIQFTLPAGTPTMQLRLDNRVGNPQMTLISGNRLPQPDVYEADFGVTSGQTSPPAGGLGIQRTGTILNIANPPSGPYTLAIRADEVSTAYPDASATVVITADFPEEVPGGEGTVAVTNHGPVSWKYFKVVVPSGILGWDVRLKDITGGDVSMVIRRDLLPSSTGTSSSWTSSAATSWPSGTQWGAGTDWSGRKYDQSATPRRDVDDRIVAAMGRPLEPGIYYIGVLNSGTNPLTSATGQTAGYTLESRWIGEGRTIPINAFNFTAGSSLNVNNLTPREAIYYKVTVPDNTPSWEFTLAPTNGEMLMAIRRGGIPDLDPSTSGEPQDEKSREVKAQKAGPERYLLLPPNGQDKIIPGDYYIAVVSEGGNPPSSSVIGTGTSSGTLVSNGAIPVPSLGTASLAPITQAVSLVSTQVKAWQFTVPEGVVNLEVRLNNRVGNPRLALISGTRLPQPDTFIGEVGVSGGQTSTPTGGSARVIADSLITLSTPPAGIYSLIVRSDDPYPDCTADLVIVAKPRAILNFSQMLNGNGYSHTDARQLTDGQKQYYEVAVPATLSGQPVLGWQLKVNKAQGAAALKIYKQWGNSGGGISISGNTALIVPPFLTFDETWYIEVTATGLTNYTLTSQPVALERPAWTMPAGHNFTFGDSGNDSAGNPLPGDRGVDVGIDDWHFYAIDVPEGNSGLLRTELKAISGNPNLYIREDGVPTTDHNATGTNGASLVHRQMDDTGSEYGNWVPLAGKSEKQLRPGRWYIGVRAAGGNARYRLIASTGQVTDLSLGSASLTNQTLIGRDWRYYRFTVPVDAPATWNLGFTQQVGDVVMWLRDTTPAGQSSGTGGGSTIVRSWASDNKNQGPYEASGHDPAGVYAFNTPPLRPGHTYYAGFRANNDATFSITSSTTGTAPVATPLAFYGGVIDAAIPAGGSLLYKFDVPAEATRLKWTSTHASTVQLRLEQGTIPALSGTQHYTSTTANSAFNQAVTATGWPWQTRQTYYLRIVNTGASQAQVLVNMAGVNAGTEDEDNDGLLDAWEVLHFGQISYYNASSDPDLDGVTNGVEFTDGTIPTNINSAKYFLNVNANFGAVAKSPDQPKYNRGTTVTLTAIPNAGLVFNGWSGSATGNTNPLTLEMLANKNINASFGIELPVALDISGLAWNTGGDAPWAGQTVTTRDGTDAAQSGGITHSQSSWMETTVSGAGTLSFHWKVSSGGGDYLEFYIDGVLQTGRISGTIDWTQKTYNLTTGDHIVRWRYVKDTSGTTGSDTGWVDQVSWIPATSGFGTWLATYFTPTEIANPAIGGTNADPDKDGVPNLLEYVFGRDPKNGGGGDAALGRVTPEVVKVAASDRLRVKFTLPDAFPVDVAISVEVSDTMAANGWTTIASKSGSGAWAGSGTAMVGNPASGRREHGITDASSSSAGKRMARIKVSLQ